MLLQAIKNSNLSTRPGLTYANVVKYLPDMPVTALGRLDQSRQGLQSTKTSRIDNFETVSYTPTKPMHQAIATLISFQQNDKGFFDLTGVNSICSGTGQLLCVSDVCIQQ